MRALAALGQMGERVTHRLHLGDTGLEIGEMPRRQVVDVATGAAAIPPQREEVDDFGGGEATAEIQKKLGRKKISDSSSSTGGPVCGDNMIEGDEVCDGAMIDNQTCAKLLPAKWGGGTLKCTDTCKSFDDTACCIGVGQPCNYLLQPDELCCPGLTCPLSGKCTVN